MRKDIVYGLRPVIEAVEAGKEIEKVFFKKGLQGDLFHSLLNLLKKNQIPFQFVPVEKLNRISSTGHQGVIAHVSGITYGNISQVIPALYENGDIPLILVLDGVPISGISAPWHGLQSAPACMPYSIPSRGSAMIGPDAL
jgi:23S rRNA (guanosine2251-2'-O)-methyltransferase